MPKSEKLVYIVLGLVVVIIMPIAVFRFTAPRTNKVPQCRFNLEIINQAKIRWSHDYHKSDKETPTWNDIKYVLDFQHHDAWSNGIPFCPSGGVYSLGPVGKKSKCSIGGYEHSAD